MGGAHPRLDGGGRAGRRAPGLGARPPRRPRDLFCYFDNDVKVRAPFDADRLMQKLALERDDPSFRFPPRSALTEFRGRPPGS